MFGNRNPFPLADAFIRSFTQRGREHDFLKARASKSRSFETYDFNQAAQSGAQYSLWTVAATSTSTTWAALAEPGGWLRGVTGASVTTGALQLSGNTKFFNGTKGAGMATLIRLSAVTEVRLEQGFADVVPAVGTNVVASLTSSTMNSVTTGVVYLYDHVSGTGQTTGLYAIGSSTGVNQLATTTMRYDSAATLFVALEIKGRKASLWVGDGANPIAEIALATTAADSWAPFINVKTSSGSKNVDVDCIWTWTDGRN